ncbi:uncharacterized protein LOC135491117 [Lineus longissimus]|uniref:uncharacterized protein LOC135491117 n=1 Tax=Lineus longissimus TaxID=88925 RepID=UPI00315CA644
MATDSSESDTEEILLLYAFHRRQKRKRRHDYWVHDLWMDREKYGEYHHLIKTLFSFEDKFFQYFRMTTAQFHDLHDLIRDDIRKLTTSFRKPIGTEEQLSICLRFLATGDSYTTISFSFRVGIKTVSRIVNETCEAIWNRLQPIFMPQPTLQQWEDIAAGFWSKWQFPNCIGAIDGKHVLIFAPKNSGTKFFKYKKTFSVDLLALVDHRYCFVAVDIGSFGSNSDGGIFKNSAFGEKLAHGELDIPEDKVLPGGEELGIPPVPHVIVGDEAFPAQEHLVRPFPGKNLS